MRRFDRLPTPEFLAENCDKWGLDWETRHTADKGSKFSWRTHSGEAVNHLLLPLLKAQTQDHCSFCDNFPVSPPSLETIEHFRPKARFHRHAYRWENLYFCCMFCQQKNEDFDEKLLRPDSPDYEFDRYFRWDFTTGRIEANELASEQDQERARITISMYRLNESHPSLRMRELRRRGFMRNEPLDDFAYRDYIES